MNGHTAEWPRPEHFLLGRPTFQAGCPILCPVPNCGWKSVVNGRPIQILDLMRRAQKHLDEELA